MRLPSGAFPKILGDSDTATLCLALGTPLFLWKQFLRVSSDSFNKNFYYQLQQTHKKVMQLVLSMPFWNCRWNWSNLGILYWTSLCKHEVPLVGLLAGRHWTTLEVREAAYSRKWGFTVHGNRPSVHSGACARAAEITLWTSVMSWTRLGVLEFESSRGKSGVGDCTSVPVSR